MCSFLPSFNLLYGQPGSTLEDVGTVGNITSSRTPWAVGKTEGDQGTTRPPGETAVGTESLGGKEKCSIENVLLSEIRG